MNDSRYWKYVREIERNCGLPIVVLPMNYQDEEKPYIICKDATPSEFVWLIKNSVFICTDSFHACVMSMMYHKEFYVLKRERKSEQDKYSDLLGRYKMTDRVVEDENQFVRRKTSNYEYFDKKIEEDRAFSISFLEDALKACENK